jgi:ubiquinone/menaquinone biosynthesis C-methylase UbiE
VNFPWHVDPGHETVSTTRKFYESAYSVEDPIKQPSTFQHGTLSPQEQSYIDYGRRAAVKSRVPEKIQRFVKEYELEEKKVLEVGAGSGLLQDIVADYTALDISPTARRFFHKPFVEASATDMPFANDTFDALWSVTVLEHIPSPEKALAEMRRVVKPGGYLLLYPAFDVSRYAANGYRVRPYSDFTVSGKVVKATSSVAEFKPAHYLYYHQVRVLRCISARLTGGPTRLRFIRLTPNYDDYWEPDSDATTSVSNYELYLWFNSRGDKCTNCPSEARLVLRDVPLPYLVIRKLG